MKEILKSLLEEASVGRVEIDGEEWPIAFNTKIGDQEIINSQDNNFITLMIKQEEEFENLLEEYISLELKANRKVPEFYRDESRNKIKWLLAFLFVNATTEDFLNPEQLIKRNIQFLKDTTLDYLKDGIEIEMGPNLKNSKLKIEKKTTSTSMETPNKIELTFQNQREGKVVEYKLPSIYYGISDGVCYIYSIQSPKDKWTSKEEEAYKKQMNRLLYKLNEGVKEVEEQEYYDYKEGKTDDYPEENITDVTHSFVMSLNIFISLLEKNHIEAIKAVPYLPIRYSSRFLAATRHQDKEKQEMLLERNDKIQTNITNKFIRTFRRLAYHNKSLEMESFPYEVDEFLTIHINPRKKELNNLLLEEASEAIEERNNITKK